MIRLKRKPKGDDYPDNVCAVSRCEEPSALTLDRGILRPHPVPLCDKHNEQRCADDEAAADAAVAAVIAESEVQVEPPPDATSKQTKKEREAVWRAKTQAEKDGKASPLDSVTEPELSAPQELEEFINAPSLRDQPKPKRKPKAKPKAKAESKAKPKAKSKTKPKPKPSGNSKGTIPIGVIKRTLIGSGVSAAELSDLSQQQTEQWMADHLSEGDRQRVLDNARKMSRTPRVRPRQP